VVGLLAKGVVALLPKGYHAYYRVVGVPGAGAEGSAQAGNGNRAQAMSSLFVLVIFPGFLCLENHLISSLDDYCKRKETKKKGD
jgi:hypothetical protein